MSEKKNVKLGALWEKRNMKGDVYYSGVFGDTKIVVFKNAYKKPGDNQPDFQIFLQNVLKKENDAKGETPFNPLPIVGDEIPF